MVMCILCLLQVCEQLHFS